MYYYVYKYVLFLLIKIFFSLIVRNVYFKLFLFIFVYLCSFLFLFYGIVIDGVLFYFSVINNNREGTEDGDSFITIDDKTEDDDVEFYDNYLKVGYFS